MVMMTIMMIMMVIIMWWWWANPYRNLCHCASKAKYGNQSYKQNFQKLHNICF